MYRRFKESEYVSKLLNIRAVLESAFISYLLLQMCMGCPSLQRGDVFTWLAEASVLKFVLWFALCFVIFVVFITSLDTMNGKISFIHVDLRMQVTRPVILLICAILYAAETAFHAKSSEGVLAMVAFAGVVGAYVRRTLSEEKKTAEAFDGMREITGSPENPSGKRKLFILAVAALGMLFITFISVIGIYRYLNYQTPGYDFGLFAQMFENMRKTGIPLTSYERDTLVSHFYVHISPIYYLMLPIYMIFPRPETLQVLQAVILALGLIPLMKLAAHFHMKDSHRVLLAAVYCLYPALSGGCYYDLHENCFLTVLLLCLFLSLEKDSWAGMIVCSVLICAVKEDAPLYAICVGLYYLFSGRRRLKGFCACALSGTWLLAALWVLKEFGEGGLVGRFSNLLYKADGSMIDVLKTIVLCPAYSLIQCFEADRIPYMAVLLIPLLFMPLYSARISELFLYIPIFLINLMPDYTYQHDIYFQYQFGVTAILFFLFVMHYRKLPGAWKNVVCIVSVLVSIVAFQSYNWEKMEVVSYHEENTEKIEAMDEAVSLIPDDSVVLASTFFVAHLYQTEQVYSLESGYTADYVILDLRYANAREAEEEYRTEEWECVYRAESAAAVYRRRNAE